MKIEKFSTKQFAGIKNKNVVFSNGINVVIGENESGKTTLINAIYHTLTEPLKLSKASKEGKSFIEECFPSSGANVIFATLSLSEKSGSYTIEREWNKDGKNSKTSIEDPKKDWNSGDRAEEILQGLLTYPKAIYNHLIFGRQNHSEQILEWCYDFFSNNSKQNDIEPARDKVAKALSAAGGISSDKFCRLLDEKINEASMLWDFSLNRPKNGRTDWQKGLGTIAKSFCEYDKALKELEQQKENEHKINDFNAVLDDCAAKRETLKRQLEELEKQNQAITSAENTLQLRNQYLKEVNAATENSKAAAKAQDILSAAEELSKLNQEYQNRCTKDKISQQLKTIRNLDKRIEELTNKTKDLSSLPNDCKQAMTLSNAINKNHANLKAGKLHAKFKMQSPHTAKVEFADNSVSEFTENEVDIDGFFRITIPNVGEIIIAPQGVDVEKLQAENEQNENQLKKILEKYSADTLDTLQNKSEEYSNNLNNLRSQSAARAAYNISTDQLEKELDEIVTNDSIIIPDNIEQRVNEFLKQNNQTSLDGIKARSKTIIEDFIKEYQTHADAKRKIDELNDKINSLVIPTDITMSKSEFDIKKQQLSKEIESLNQNREDAIRSLGSLEAEMKDISEVREEANRLKTIWENELHLCENYMRIRDDYQNLMVNNTDDKFSVFNQKFTKYLEFITGDSLSSSGVDSSDKLVLKSNTNELNSARLLSEGTKETLLLAFRLAVLDYFFPNGDGLIVLDDILLDMDEKRRKKSVELLKEFAKNNQVIFMTCDDNIANLMGGNKIVITR